MSTKGTALPRLERYVADLPGGLDAHPAAQAKGSLVRSVLAGQRVDELLPLLPAALRRLAADPPMAGEWVPEVHFGALFHAVADARGLSEKAVCAWSRAQNRALFRSPIYRILMAAISPGSMLRFAGRRWGAFHRGTELEVDGIADDGVRLALSFPARLFDRLLVVAYAEGFAAALEMAGARSPEVLLEELTDTSARYAARW